MQMYVLVQAWTVVVDLAGNGLGAACASGAVRGSLGGSLGVGCGTGRGGQTNQGHRMWNTG